MLTDVQIINNGLGKISASRIKRIDPPQTPLEGFVASGYPQWKRSELTKRRWVFALEDNFLLTLTDEIPDVDQPFKYPLPVDCLRPVRGKFTEWKQRGRFILSGFNTLRISYVRNALEAEFDPLFNDVLSARVALETAEYLTQSNTKKADAVNAHYNPAVKAAAQANAFVIGPEDVSQDDGAYGWVNARYD